MYNISIDNEKFVVSGDFNDMEYNDLEQLLDEYLETDLKDHIIDISKVRYINSSAIFILVKRLHTIKKRVSIIVNKDLRWQIVGLTTLKKVNENIKFI